MDGTGTRAAGEQPSLRRAGAQLARGGGARGLAAEATRAGARDRAQARRPAPWVVAGFDGRGNGILQLARHREPLPHGLPGGLGDVLRLARFHLAISRTSEDLSPRSHARVVRQVGLGAFQGVPFAGGLGGVDVRATGGNVDLLPRTRADSPAGDAAARAARPPDSLPARRPRRVAGGLLA